jgi:hypothetical protein
LREKKKDREKEIIPKRRKRRKKEKSFEEDGCTTERTFVGGKVEGSRLVDSETQ